MGAPTPAGRWRRRLGRSSTAAVRAQGGQFAESTPLQRIYRDSAIAAWHAVILPIVNYEIYGKALLGRGDQITPLV